MQTAIMLVGLTAFGAFIVDYGVLWLARRQVQNAADSAALAAAISLGFDAPGDQAQARQNAIIAAGQNPVWGLPADIRSGDITFPACPVGSVPSGGGGVCVRVEVFRNQRGGGTPLPTIFANLVNVTEQGVKATATAQVLYGSAADCVKPFAIPDKWQELRGNVGPAGWDPLDTFERYTAAGTLLPGVVDYYEPPSGPLFGPNGTGYSRGTTGLGPGDYGASVEFKPGLIPGKAGNASFLPVHITPGGLFGGDITSCASRVIQPGDTLEVELNNVAGEFAAGVLSLVAQDPGAVWNPGMNGGLGGVSGGCMTSGGCTVSPRIIALPVFSPDAWDALGAAAGTVTVTRVIGFFVQRLEGAFIVGRFMVYPSAPRSTMTDSPQSAFVISAALVR
ncbi:MAG TPA: pilus assembly protein TadG-related protein [Vicinamibacterales bacterium]|nr:pilus assembly protein TadG-related protein [Vicinamibacterales bacterium]